MNEDIVNASSNFSKQRILDLNKEVVECRVCPRLVEYREGIARVKKKRFLSWNYWGRPVPGFGDTAALIFVIGLAPASHGGNRTHGVYMTAAVKCAPPNDKPTNEEMANCAHFLKSELEICNKSRIILCLGQFAYRSTMAQLTKNNLFTSKIPTFEHGLKVNLPDGRKVVASYHPSPRNTQTGTLTADMFVALLRKIRKDLSLMS